MADETTTTAPRRRRRWIGLALLGVGVAGWTVRSRLGARHGLDDGWTVALDRAPGPVIEAAPPVPAPAPAPAVEPAPVVAAEKPSPRPRAVPAATATLSVAAPALAVPDAPYGPGSLRALPDGTSPDPAYAVKAKTGSMRFHPPGSTYYSRTKADVWFATVDAAQQAGFSATAPRRRVAPA